MMPANAGAVLFGMPLLLTSEACAWVDTSDSTPAGAGPQSKRREPTRTRAGQAFFDQPPAVPSVSIGVMSQPRRVALALGSGGARGFAHIGVVQVLEERGFEVVAVAG